MTPAGTANRSLQNGLTKADLQSIVEAGALDMIYFGRTFFPKAIRQDSPAFHQDIANRLAHAPRLLAMEVFRGGAKTTLGRVFAAQRVSYGVSKAIGIMSRSQRHAIASIQWLKNNVEHNRFWRDTFKIRRGTKWAEDHIEIFNDSTQTKTTVIAMGITGQLRGFNFDDFRLDLLVADDPDDEETTNTEEQREKTSNLFYGAALNSLAPRSEDSDAMALLLQTPLNPFDLISQAKEDPAWEVHTYGCFDEDGESRWPARWTTEELKKEKQSYSARNMMSLWMREKECKVIPAETRPFRLEWLKYWEQLPEHAVYYMAIDPASSDREDADFQAVAVIGLAGRCFWLAEYQREKGQTLDSLFTDVYRLYWKYRPLAVGIETVSYQKTAKWYIEKAAQETGRPLPIQEINDKRPKIGRIIDNLRSYAADGKLFVHADHREFIQEFVDYPGVRHDDLLDAVAMAIELVDHSFVSEMAFQQESSTGPAKLYYFPTAP